MEDNDNDGSFEEPEAEAPTETGSDDHVFVGKKRVESGSLPGSR